MTGAFVAVNYGTIQISGRLAAKLAISAPLEWTIFGATAGLIYKPAAPPLR